MFLALRAAHDVLAKAARQNSTRPSAPNILPSSTTPGTGIRQAGQLPVTPNPATIATNHTNARSAGALPQIARPAVARPPSPSADGTQPMPPGGVRKPAPPATPTSASASTRPSGGHPALKPEHELAGVLELVEKERWDQARSALHGLAAKSPSDTKIRALLAYTHGREAQLKGEIDEARVELMSALQMDPELQIAKTALGELFRRK